METKAVHEKEPCGCIGLGYAVHFCPLHAQAEGMRQFIANYLWSEHSECPPDREAVPLSAEQLADDARALLRATEGK